MVSPGAWAVVFRQGDFMREDPQLPADYCASVSRLRALEHVGLDRLLRMVADAFRLERFAYVDDAGALHEDVTLTPELIATNCGCRLGRAILELVKVR
jgi:hypothetical protein